MWKVCDGVFFFSRQKDIRYRISKNIRQCVLLRGGHVIFTFLHSWLSCITFTLKTFKNHFVPNFMLCSSKGSQTTRFLEVDQIFFKMHNLDSPNFFAIFKNTLLCLYVFFYVMDVWSIRKSSKITHIWISCQNPRISTTY